MKYSITILIFLNLLYSNSIAIYSNNLAFVNQNYDINITNSNTILVNNLPKTIIPDSIFVNNLNLISKEFIPQDYNYIKSLIEANLGASIEFLYNKKVYKGKIIHKEPLIIKSNNKLYIVKDISNIIFNNEPKFKSNSKLIMHLANKGKFKKLNLNYLIRGISWNANYIVSLNDKNLNIQAWADIKNNTQAQFKNVKIKLISGNLNSSNYDKQVKVLKSNDRVVYPAVAEIPVVNKIASYYSFDIPKRETINKNSQILLYKVNNVKYKEYGVAENSSFYRYIKDNFKFRDTIEFDNTKTNNLGKIFPQGVARVYKDDIYLGEDRVKNIAKNQKIQLIVGTIFDAVGSKKIVEYKENKHYKKVTTKYTIKNQGNRRLQLKLYENIQRYGNKISYNTSCKNNCSLNEIDAFKKEFTINLESSEKYEFTTSFEVYY